MRYYVEPGATGTGIVGGNTWASAGDLDATLNYVINRPSRGGDEIWALNGPYYLAAPLVINNNKEPLSIYGGFKGGENTLCERDANISSLQYPTFFQNPSILDGRNANRVINMQNANVCRIDGFVIQNGNATTATTGLEGGGMRVSGRNIWLENLVIMDNAAGNNGGGIFTTPIWGLVIKNTIFFNNQATNGGGLGIGDGRNTLLVNVLFNGNQANGGDGNAIHIMGSNSLKIINNTISGNIGSSATSSSVYCMQNPNLVEIYNSIIYPDSLTAAGSAVVNVGYCYLSNPLPTPPLPATINNLGNNIVSPVNPFINSAGGDFHLQPGSQCIDAGNTNLIFPYSATDLEGNPRFINNTAGATTIEVDMGAFEVQ